MPDEPQCEGVPWRCRPWRYPEPFPPIGTICPECGAAFDLSPGMRRLFENEDTTIDWQSLELLRFLFEDTALAFEAARCEDGHGEPVSRRAYIDKRMENAGLHGLLEGQQERIREVFGDE